MVGQAVDGILVLNKPSGITSRGAVDRASRWFPSGTRLGHTGTLDPLASGVLVLCVGSATRLAAFVQRMKKIYRAAMRFGAESTTDDAEGTVTPNSEALPPSEGTLRTALASWVGEVQQTPPAHSAAWVSGQRAYRLARKGKKVELAPRTVQIHAIELESYAYPVAELRIFCSRGTYIRSLARDLGKQLGCGAYLQSLSRLAVGAFTIENAVPIDAEARVAQDHLMPAQVALRELPWVAITDELACKFRQGQGLGTELLAGCATALDAQELGVFSDGELVGVGRLDIAGGMVKPVIVLPRSR